MELPQTPVGALCRHRKTHRIVMVALLRIRTCLLPPGQPQVQRFPLPGQSRAGRLALPAGAVAGFAVGGEGAVAGVGQGPEVELGGGDVPVPEAFLDDLDATAPPASSQEACAARRWWNVTLLPASCLAAVTAGAQNLVRKLFRDSTVPTLEVNSRSLSRTAYSTMCSRSCLQGAFDLYQPLLVVFWGSP